MEINADIYNVVEALENGREETDEGHLCVWDKDVIMRGVTDGEMDERNIDRGEYRDLVCSFDWESAGLLKLNFHEEAVEEEFCLNPVGTGAIDPQQATQPEALGEALGLVVKQVNYAYDVHKWDFSKVNGASIAHGGYVTDYEFQYETFI